MTDHAHDFDFLLGKWRVHHWRLRERLGGSHDWIEFEGTCRNWMTMGGHGNVDDNDMPLPGGAFRGVGIRGYEARTQTWAIWWLDARDPQTIGPPVIGNFKKGVGIFEGDDTFRGKPIKARFIWLDITPSSAHWEQAFSPDGGESWETNWRMGFRRVE